MIAIRNSYGLNLHSHVHEHKDGMAHKHFHFHSNTNKRHTRHTHALTTLGILHGLAGGTHLIAFLPALALPIQDSVIYLLSYIAGSLLIMILFTFLISISILKTKQKFVSRLIFFAGGISFSMGLFWLQKSSTFIFN